MKTERTHPPRIRRFAAHPASDGGVEFSWSVREADRLRILFGSQVVMDSVSASGGAVVVRDLATGRYTLEATNEKGPATISINVSVNIVAPEAPPDVAAIAGAAAAAVSSDAAGGSPQQSITSVNPFKVVKNGRCPICNRKARPHEPPVNDQRYKQQIEMLKGEYKERHQQDLSDDEAHALWLKRMGGYIAQCPKDSTDFFVRV